MGGDIDTAAGDATMGGEPGMEVDDGGEDIGEDVTSAHAALLSGKNVPAAVVHETKRRFIDSIATAVGAMDAEAYAAARACAQRVQGNPGANLFGGGSSSVQSARQRQRQCFSS